MPALIEYLETRELFSGAAVNPTNSASDLGVLQLNEATGEWQASRFNGTDFVSETVTTWKGVPEQTVVVHGDLWGTGQHEMVRFDRATGNFTAEWKSGSGISTGVVATWVPNMDLQFLTIQDLNHDGRDDIIARDAATGKWAASISVGAFGYNTRFVGTWQTGVDWKHVTIADINGDRLDDILAINPLTEQWNILVATSGAYTPMSVGNPISVNRIQQLVVANFDDNPGLDVLQRDSVTGIWLKSSMISNDFYSQAPGSWNPAQSWTDVVTLDFWGSGRDAVLGRNATTNEWQILWAAGSGYVGSDLGVWGPGQYADAQVGDFNGDGREDLLARQVSTGRWYSLSASASAVNTTLVGNWTAGATYDVIESGDFNQDGKTDLVGRQATTGTWFGLLSSPNGAVSSSLSATEFGYTPTEVMLGDFDADGKADVLSRDNRTGNRLLIEFEGSKLLASRFNTWTAYGNSWTDRQVIDFNGDGDTDLLARDATTGDWWLTTLVGTKPTTAKVANWDPSATWQSLVTTDFDGNGSIDVVARNTTTGDWHLLRSENGVVSSRVIANWSTSATWTDFQTADMFGNGRHMVVARDTTTNLWHGLWSSGTGFATSNLRGLALGRNYADTRVVDFFGDGRETVVTRDTQTGVWYGLWYGNNQFRLTNLGGWNPAGNWESIVAADLEGDGSQALYGHDAVSGQWRRITFNGMTPTNTIVAQTRANLSLKLTSVGNFLDPTRDSILAQSTTGGNWYRLSYAGSSFQSVDLGLWAESATWTTTTVGDYNRDGRADVFGYSSNLNSWRIRSFDGANWFSVAAGNLSPSAKIVDVPGASSATLRAAILSDLPGLRAALNTGNTRSAVQQLRMWTSNAGDLALFNNPMLTEAASASEAFYSAYARDKAGSSCGGLSEFYTQILKLFSIDSLTINMGDVTADLVHTTVIVPIWENNAWSFELYDPTFNGTLINTTTNRPVSYLDVISSVQAGNTTQFGIEEASNANREFLSAVPVNSPSLTLETVKDGVYVYRWANYGIDDYLTTYQPYFLAHGYSPGLPGFMELMPKVLSVYANNGSGNPQTSANMKAAFLAGLQARGINVPP